MIKEKSKHLVLIDAYGFIFRAYHSLPPLNNPHNMPVGALYGFISMIMRLLDNVEMSHICLVFDSGGKNFRHQIDPEYKSHRPEVPSDLKSQFPLIREFAKFIDILGVEKSGFEADDIIATYCNLAKKEDFKVTIVSSDKDLTQLVCEQVQMFDPVKNKYLNREGVKEKFGVYPEQIIDYLALVGDSSDNISGVPSIGPKSALELLGQFASIEDIYQGLSEVTQEKRREKLRENQDKAFVSKKLVALDRNIKDLPELEELILKNIDYFKLMKFLEFHNFKSLIAKFQKKNNSMIIENANYVESFDEVKQEKIDFLEITNIEQLSEAFANIEKIGYLSFLTFYHLEEVKICSFTIGKNYYYFSVGNGSGESNGLFESSQPSSASLMDFFIEKISDKSLTKITYDAKKFLAKLKKEIFSTEDLMIMSYIVENGKNSHELADIIKNHVNLEVIEFEKFVNPGRKKPNLSNLEKSETEEYIGSYLRWIDPVFRLLKSKMFEENSLYVYENIDKPLINILNNMENQGVKVDRECLSKLSSYFSGELALLEKEIFRLANCEFNIGSPKQLGEIIFEKLELDKGKRSKSGSYSTDASTLEDLSYKGHVIADLIIKWRQLSKLKSTYSDALQNQIDENTGNIHTSFNLCVTSTGRLSSVNPNLQNIPIRTEEGTKIRSAFIAKPGYLLVSADYSQIELRILAHIADIKTLQQAFIDNKDIHVVTASQVFGVAEKDVTKDLRRNAKTINFGIIYGISGFGLAKRLGIDRKSASDYIENYLTEYPGIEKYMEDTKEEAKKYGYVKSLSGRRCYVKDINNSNATIRSFAERAAINAPIQGTASDIIKKSMIKIDNELAINNLDAKMILQVHDELLFEVDQKNLQKLVKLIRNSMENYSYKVPMTVDVSVGQNWSNLLEYKEEKENEYSQIK